MFFKSETLPAGASLTGSVSSVSTSTATPASSATGATSSGQPVGSIATLKESLLANKENHTTTGPQSSSSSTTLTGSSSSTNSSNSSVPGLASTGSKVSFFFLFKMSFILMDDGKNPFFVLPFFFLHFFFSLFLGFQNTTGGGVEAGTGQRGQQQPSHPT